MLTSIPFYTKYQSVAIQFLIFHLPLVVTFIVIFITKKPTNKPSYNTPNKKHLNCHILSFIFINVSTIPINKPNAINPICHICIYVMCIILQVILTILYTIILILTCPPMFIM